MCGLFIFTVAITISFCLSTIAEDKSKIGKRHSLLLIKEASLRDSVSQIRRGILYSKVGGLQVEKEETELVTLDTILKDVGLFKVKESTKSFELNYGVIEERVEKGQKVAEDVLKSLREKFKEKYPWFKPNIREAELNTRKKGYILKRGVLHRYFYGTRMPVKTQQEKLEKTFSSIEPFRFDFIQYGYNEKKINQQEGRYSWETLNKGLMLLNKYGYPMDVTVNFGSMKAWPLMEKFSWIPRKYPGAEIKEMLFQNDRGEVLWRSGFHSVLNIWHPVILKYEKDWVSALGKYCQNLNIAIYELFNEMGLTTNKRPVGYGKYAQISFHKYLEKNYGNIEKLNERLSTSYPDFEVIKLPTRGSYVKGNVPIGLIYEFERFRKEGLVDYMKDMIAELRKADSNIGHAISSQFTGWLNDAHTPKMSARDFLMLASLDWDLYGVHTAGDGRYPAITLLYHYCINRYAKKIYWDDEFWWDYREAADQKIEDEAILRAVAERNMWRHIAYGVKGFNIFPGLYSSEPGGLLTEERLMRYATGAFSLVINKINKYADIFFDGHLLNQKIGILQPSTTLDITAGEFLANENAMKLSDWMLSEHVIPFYIPEECIIDGRENINEFKLLISPYALFIPAVLSEKIKKWVENGGIFISVGPFGKFDQYGKKRETFVKDMFKNKDTETITQKYGKGKVVILKKKIAYSDYTRHIRSELESLRVVSSNLKPEVLQLPLEKDKFTGERNFYAKSDIDLIPWEDKQGNKFLFVINLDPSKRLEPKIKIKGEYKKILDLTIDGELPVAAISRSGFTEFTTLLEPGQGIIYKLDQKG
jgi:hypothetical protein